MFWGFVKLPGKQPAATLLFLCFEVIKGWNPLYLGHEIKLNTYHNIVAIAILLF